MEESGKSILYIASTAEHLRSFHLPYLRALRQAGYQVTAAGAGDGRGLPEGVGFLPLPFEKRCLCPDNLRALRLLVKELRRRPYALVAVHTSLAAFYARLALLCLGRDRPRCVNTVHGYLFDESSPVLRRSLLLGAERLCRGVTDDLLVMNAQDLRIARSRRLCRGQVALIPGMGVDFRPFAPPSAAARQAARRRFALPEGALVLLCAAEFSARKNQAFLIRALGELPENVYLLLPGEGALRPSCLSLAGELGLRERLRFPGRLPSAAEACRAADVYVSASRCEGLPFAVMEAMHCGLPVVLSRVKGHEDLISSQDVGRLYPLGDREAFCRCVRELAAFPDLRARLGAAAQEAAAPYALERVLPRVLPWYLTNGRTSAIV